MRKTVCGKTGFGAKLVYFLLAAAAVPSVEAVTVSSVTELQTAIANAAAGDEIVIADANFPCGINKKVIRADGIGGAEMLDAILKVIPLDTYADPNMILMNLTQSDVGKVNPTIWKDYEKIAEENDDNVKIGGIERFSFYDRAKTAYVVVATGEGAIYANIILKKGVIK